MKGQSRRPVFSTLSHLSITKLEEDSINSYRVSTSLKLILEMNKDDFLQRERQSREARMHLRLLITAELKPKAEPRSSKQMSHSTWRGSKASARHQSELKIMALANKPDEFL